MPAAIRQRLTYANVMATIAVFLALGGGAYAAVTLPAHSVGTKQLRRHAVNASKLAAKSVGNAALAANAVTSAKVKDGSLLGADIRVASLPKVPSAATADTAATAANANALGGTPASAYITTTRDEPFHLVGGGGEPGFGAGWANLGGGYQTAGFYKDQFGVVHLRGEVQMLSGTSATIFTLPAGYRPTATEQFGAGNGGASAGVITITGAGAVSYATGDPGSMGLNGITFRTTN